MEVKTNNISNLLEEFTKVGVCETGKRYLKGTPKDIETLIKVWRRWPEYLYEHSEYALSILRKYLTEENKKYLAGQHLFVDFTGSVNISIENSEHPVFILGDSDCIVSTTHYAVLKMYVFNSSRVELSCEDHSINDIEAFNNSYLNINVDSDSKCKVYQYDKAEIIGNAEISSKEYKRGLVFNGKEINEKTE